MIEIQTWQVTAVVLAGLAAVVNGFEGPPEWCPPMTRIPGYFNMPLWPTQNQMQIYMIMGVGGLVQLAIGLYVIYPQFFAACLPLLDRVPTGKMSQLRQYIASYLIVTMTFSFALCWELNYYVMIFATIHNWFEWQILGSVYLGADLDKKSNGCCFTRRTFNIFFIVYVFFLVQLTGLHIPEFSWGLFFVQLAGLHCDAQLCLVGIYKFFSGKPEHKMLNAKFFTASFSHICMIGCLFFQIAGFLPKFPAGTLLISLSLYTSCIFWALFALEHDLMIEDEMKKNGEDIEASALLPNDADDLGSSTAVQAPAEAYVQKDLETTNTIDVPVPALWQALVMFVGLCIAAGVLIGSTMALPDCPAVAILDDEIVWVTYVDIDSADQDTVHEELIAMKKEAMLNKHNEFYRVLEGAAANMLNPGGEFLAYPYTKFLVFEKWSDEKERAAFQKEHVSFYDNIKALKRGYEIMNPADNVVKIPPTKGLVSDYDAADLDTSTACLSTYRVGTTSMTLKPTGWWDVFSRSFMAVAKSSREQSYNVFYMPLLAYHDGKGPEDPNSPNTDMFLIESYNTAADFFEHFMTQPVIIFGAISADALQIAALYGPFKEVDMFTHCAPNNLE